MKKKSKTIKVRPAPANYIMMVGQFHQIFKHPIGKNSRADVSLELRRLRLRLLFEELCELAEASDCMEFFGKLCDDQVGNMATSEGGYRDGNEVNRVEELDALCDLQYVLSGTILTYGLQDVFDKNFRRVHENNLLKAHPNLKHARETISRKGGHKVIRTKIPGWGFWFIVQDKGGKTIKPWDHEKVDLTLD